MIQILIGEELLICTMHKYLLLIEAIFDIYIYIYIIINYLVYYFILHFKQKCGWVHQKKRDDYNFKRFIQN